MLSLNAAPPESQCAFPSVEGRLTAPSAPWDDVPSSRRVSSRKNEILTLKHRCGVTNSLVERGKAVKSTAPNHITDDFERTLCSSAC